MATRKKEKSERSEIVSFWVNVLVVGVVMVVLGFYLGTYMLDIWRSGDTDVTPDMFASTEGTGVDDLTEQPGVGEAPSVDSSTSTQGPDQPVVQGSDSSVSSTSGGLYRVQVGAFDERESAEVMAGKLKREGYADAWVTSTAPYRVQVGAYSNPDNATKIVKQLEGSGYTVHIVN